jgi:hypothetical protein
MMIKSPGKIEEKEKVKSLKRKIGEMPLFASDSIRSIKEPIMCRR